MKIAFQRARKNHAVGVDEFHLIAGAEESDGRAFGDVDFDGIGQRAAHDGLFDPGERFDLAPAGVERDAQDAVVAVGAENFAHAIGGDVVGFGNLHLVGMNQGHGRRGKQKMADQVGCGGDGEADAGPKADAGVAFPGFLSEFAPLDFERLLAAQILRLFVSQDFLGIRFGVHGPQFFQMMTSVSSSTPCAA